MHKILWAWFIVHCGDYNPFTFRMCFSTPLALISYYFQLTVECKIYADPFVEGSERLNSSAQNGYILSRMVSFMLVLVFTNTHHYFN